MKLIKWVALVAALFFLPQVVLSAQWHTHIYRSIDTVPEHEYGVVFGAAVYPDRVLSPVVYERIEAAVRLYEAGKIQKLYISGTNAVNDEVEALQGYAVERGVAEDAIVTDYLGLDTNDTCKHIKTAALGKQAVVITQQFHLPRTLHMCENQDLEVVGLAVNKLGILEERGSDTREVLLTKGTRFVRESGLMWLYSLGLYDRFSKEAENIHQQQVFANKDEEQQELLKIIKIPVASSTLSVEHSDTPRLISAWKNGDEEVIINGGYFHPDYTPSGFVVSNGERIGEREFDQDKTGLLQVKAGVASIRDLQVNPITKDETFEHALQSYPFLIKNGKPAIAEDSGKVARRTAIGIDSEGNLYAILLDAMSISLYAFMEELVKTEIPFTYVLNVDGGPSSGMYAKLNDIEFLEDNYAKVPNVIRIKVTR